MPKKNEIKTDNGSPLHHNPRKYRHTTIYRDFEYHYQVRRLTYDLDVNVDQGHACGDVFIHGDKTWVYQGEDADNVWIEYASNDPEIKCPIPELTNHVFYHTGQWRLGNNLTDEQKVKEVRNEMKRRKRQRVDSGDEEEEETMDQEGETTDLNSENGWSSGYKKSLQNSGDRESPLISRMIAILTHVESSQTAIPFFKHSLDGPQPNNIRFTPSLTHHGRYMRSSIVEDLYQNKIASKKVGITHSDPGLDDPACSIEDLVASLMGGCEPVLAADKILATTEGMGRMKIRWADPFKNEEDIEQEKEREKSNRKEMSRSTRKGKEKEKEKEKGEKFKVLGEDEGSTLTPFGHTTFPRLEHYYANFVVYHLEGTKMWFTWPPTVNNLEFFWKNFDENTKHDFVFWIHGLDELEVFVVDTSGMSFVMPPFTIHACLSLSMSSHSGAPVMDESCLDMIWASMYAKSNLELGQLSNGARDQQIEERKEFVRAKKLWLTFSQDKESGFSVENKERVDGWVSYMDQWADENYMLLSTK